MSTNQEHKSHQSERRSNQSKSGSGASSIDLDKLEEEENYRRLEDDAQAFLSDNGSDADVRVKFNRLKEKLFLPEINEIKMMMEQKFEHYFEETKDRIFQIIA